MVANKGLSLPTSKMCNWEPLMRQRARRKATSQMGFGASCVGVERSKEDMENCGEHLRRNVGSGPKKYSVRHKRW